MPFIGLSKPPEQTLSSTLHVGSRAPESSFLKPDCDNLIVFLRHTGCPFAEAALKLLSDYSKTYPEINCCAVFHGEKIISEQWISAFNLSSDLTFIFDEQREHYGKWGVGYSEASHLVNPMMLVNLIKLALKGIRNREASGTRWQQQAAFVVDENGTVRWFHFPVHAGDLPDFFRLN